MKEDTMKTDRPLYVLASRAAIMQKWERLPHVERTPAAAAALVSGHGLSPHVYPGGVASWETIPGTYGHPVVTLDCRPRCPACLTVHASERDRGLLCEACTGDPAPDPAVRP